MITARTLSMLRYLADAGEVPLHVLIAAFWPKVERKRAHTLALSWVRKQSSAGYVSLSPLRGLDTTARLTPKGAAVFERRMSPGAVGHPRARAHHAATLRFIEQVKASLPPGERVALVMLEPELRAKVQAGHRTKRGQSFDAFPDAVLELERRLDDGKVVRRRVAVEYVTSKYTSRDIVEKATSFRQGYDDVLWVADTPRTTARVEALAGARCACLT